MTTRKCPVCGGSESSLYLVKNDFRLARCGSCSMVYTNPVPEAYLDGSFYEDAGRPFYLSKAKLAGDFSPVRFERELRLFRAHCLGGRVLDVGCSTGAFLWQLKSRFGADYEVEGSDVSGPPLDYAESKGVRVIRGDFLTHPFSQPYDAVTFWAVLEHVENPGAFVKRAWEVLRPGGVCFILVPNLSSLAVRVLKGKYRYILPQHINYFNLSTLRRLACPPFEEVYGSTSHFNPMVAVKDFLGRKEASAGERAELLVRTNALKQKGWLAPARWGYRGTEWALAWLGLADNVVVVLRRSN